MIDYDFEDFETDSNNDDYPDTNVEQFDYNGDGVIDRMVIESDMNGDGEADAFATALDSDNNGMFDMFRIQQDTTGDGQLDTYTKAFDYNQDGEIDSVSIYNDSDGDGAYESVTKIYDSDDDGTMDKVDAYLDTEGEGNFHETYSLDPSTGMLIPEVVEGSIGGTMISDLDNFQPSEDYPDGISGDPAEAMDFWEFQGDTNRCALFSQKFVIEELDPNHEEIDIEEFADDAEENGWFTENGGTSLFNMNKMLNYYGIENNMVFHQSIDDIEDCLNEGGKVIVAIDCHEIWFGEDNNIFSPASAPNHAVEVIGVDHTDPENPMVILNDSGSPYGKGEMVPLDVFEGAWEDGDCQMIECYPQ